MFETSATRFPRQKNLAKGIPFLLRVNFQELLLPDISIGSEKIVCTKCGAFLTTATDIKSDEKIGFFFECVFCGTLNNLAIKPTHLSNSLEIPLSQSVVQALDDSDLEEPTPDQPTGRPWIACIDTSGSMQGPPIVAVKRSLGTTLDSLKASKNIPSFGLVEFNYHVHILNLTDGSRTTIPAELYFNIDEMKQKTLDGVSTEFLADLESNIDACKSYINSLRADGGTALGPALVSSLALAEAWNAERVILLTDGMANIGIGALEGPTSGGARFYQLFAQSCRNLGISIDIVGVVSGQHLQLKTLGILSRLTRGNMYYTNPIEIGSAIDDIASTESIASDLRMRIVSSKPLKINDASGFDPIEVEGLIEMGQTNLSNVSLRDEVYVALEANTVLDSDVSIQLQLSYLDKEGKRRNRIFSANIPIADNEQEFIDSIDPTIPATFAVQKSATGYIADGEGNQQIETDVLQEMSKTLRNVGKHSKNESRFRISANRLTEMVSIIYERIGRWRERNVMHFIAPVYRFAQADYEFVDAIRRSRMTRDELFFRSKEQPNGS